MAKLVFFVGTHLMLYVYHSYHLSHVLLLDGLEEVVPVRAAGLGARLQPGYEVRLGPLVHQVERQMQHHSLEVCGRKNSLCNISSMFLGYYPGTDLRQEPLR